MVRRLVEQQDVGARAEDDGQTHSVALADREAREAPRPVRARGESCQCGVDAPLTVPCVEAGRQVEGLREGFVCSGFVSRHRLAGGVERVQCGLLLAQGLIDEITDCAVVFGVERLFEQGDGTCSPQHSLIGRKRTGEDMQQGRLSAAVLADDGQPRTGGDRQVEAGEDLAVAAHDVNVLGADVCGRSCGQVEFRG